MIGHPNGLAHCIHSEMFSRYQPKNDFNQGTLDSIMLLPFEKYPLTFQFMEIDMAVALGIRRPSYYYRRAQWHHSRWIRGDHSSQGAVSAIVVPIYPNLIRLLNFFKKQKGY